MLNQYVMSKCVKCGKEVDCGCNLINGSCHTCVSKGVSPTESVPVFNKISYTQSANIPANTEFDKILNQKSLSKQEKLKRINDILQKAIDNAISQQ